MRGLIVAEREAVAFKKFSIDRILKILSILVGYTEMMVTILYIKAEHIRGSVGKQMPQQTNVIVRHR